MISEIVIKIFGSTYPEVIKNKDFILTEMAREESKFRNTIEQGIKEFEKLSREIQLKETIIISSWRPGRNRSKSSSWNPFKGWFFTRIRISVRRRIWEFI